MFSSSYYSLIRCIKSGSSFNELERNDKAFACQPAISMILKAKKGAAIIYQTLMNKTYDSKGKKKWIHLLHFEDDDWLSYFAMLKRTTPDTKLRWLQYRIIHNILTTNRSAAKFIENQSDLCSFCNRESESIHHLLWQCEIVRSFWTQLSDLINRRCKHAHNIKIDERLALFGLSDSVYTDRVLDLIILMAKLFIYRCKVQTQPLIIRLFIRDIYERFCIEKTLRRDSVKFRNEWEHYTILFQSLL